MDEIVMVNGYGFFDYDYPKETLEFARDTLDIHISRLDYLLIKKDIKIAEAEKRLVKISRKINDVLFNRETKVTSEVENMKLLHDLYKQGEFATNTINMHERDRVKLISKHLKLKGNDVRLNTVNVDFEIDELPF